MPVLGLIASSAQGEEMCTKGAESEVMKVK